ncbi:hypothetical protein Hamer_G011313 [Homarus americanus]|uniref:Uncharacterized protein n=1 Tax=Homarus americanus TaxID=6706 RepID=A0A8J5JPY0_HOMAM|nr:hypothetical protein Hamer_G011313 [Homarus americanus]
MLSPRECSVIIAQPDVRLWSLIIFEAHGVSCCDFRDVLIELFYSDTHLRMAISMFKFVYMWGGGYCGSGQVVKAETESRTCGSLCPATVVTAALRLVDRSLLYHNLATHSSIPNEERI